jgi:hypothetical protein
MRHGPNYVNFRLRRAFDGNRRLALAAQKLRNLPPSHCECQPCFHIEDAPRESIRAFLLGEASTVKVERSKALRRSMRTWRHSNGLSCFWRSPHVTRQKKLRIAQSLSVRGPLRPSGVKLCF